MTPKEIIRLEHLGLRYSDDRFIFFDITCSINAGEFYFLTGKSGAGKTSLLKILYKDIQPTLGFVHVFGYSIGELSRSDLPVFRQHIGLIFQDCRLIPTLSIVDNVALSIHIGGSQYRRSCSYAKELLDWVGLGDCLNSLPDALSDGQKQRVAIARAVVKRPALLLADEPTGNLDNENAFRLMALFQELHKMGTTVVLATHNNELVKGFQYPQLILKDGSLFVNDNGFIKKKA
ncbi:MAG: ATP-binding cassette domain-containing protein [Holosporales bacterium]|jgi:cell division transport system ATP-binding protein|nr:ATP-binding cassette domain-containing protein [Holosporales bacterium]